MDIFSDNSWKLYCRQDLTSPFIVTQHVTTDILHKNSLCTMTRQQTTVKSPPVTTIAGRDTSIKVVFLVYTARLSGDGPRER